MKITKATGSFNEYKLELSWGELEAVYNSMAQSHSGPIADEVFAGLKWYMDNGNLPLPGEEKKPKDEKPGDAGADADAYLPDPDEFAQLDRPAPEGPERLAQVEPGAGDDDGERAGGSKEDEADKLLPKPPTD